MSEQPTPSQRVTGYIWPAIGIAQAIHVTAELNLPDVIGDTPKTAAELAQQTHCHAPTLFRLLRALTSIDIFAQDADGKFRNTPLSDTLRKDHPDSVHPWAAMLPAHFIWKPWAELSHAVKTGEVPFNRVFGTGVFDYFSAHPEDGEIFNSSMRVHGSFGAGIAAAYDFSRVEFVADLGGGHGGTLYEILAVYPKLRGMLFDLPSVVAGADILRNAPFAGRAAIVAGDFLQAAPEGPDVYLLCRVIHDWSDADATTILQNCRRAIPTHGTLLLAEVPLPPCAHPSQAFGDLLMLIFGGVERTESEYRALLHSCGFELTRVIPVDAHFILEARPI